MMTIYTPTTQKQHSKSPSRQLHFERPLSSSFLETDCFYLHLDMTVSHDLVKISYKILKHGKILQ